MATGRVAGRGECWWCVSVLCYMRSRWGGLDEERILLTGIRCCCCCAAAIGEVVVEAGPTCGSPGNHGIEARRRAWVA